MEFTQEELDAMSKVELNFMVAKKLGIESIRVTDHKVFIGVKQPGENVISSEGVFNPYEKLNDCIPIAQNPNMHLDLDRYSAPNQGSTKPQNPCRAICEKFLTGD